MKNKITLALSIIVAFIFVQSLFFKFSGATETVIIFNTIGDWMASIGISTSIAGLFAQYGGYSVGAVELVASILILLPKTRAGGALLSLGVISGAIFFHLFTPLGVDRVVDAVGNTDGGALFVMACVVWVSSAAVILLNRYTIKENTAVALSYA